MYSFTKISFDKRKDLSPQKILNSYIHPYENDKL